MKKTNSQKLKDVAREFHRGWPDRTIICCWWVTDLRHNFFRTFLLKKKCFNFGCPSLGYNSEFWFYHQKCHFLCPHLGIFQTTKGSIGEPKLKFCGYIAKKCLHNVKVDFGPKMSSCSLTAVKLLPSCHKARLLPKCIMSYHASLVPSK